MEVFKINEIELLLEDIEKLKSSLNELIEDKKSNLQDPEIVASSQILNAAITKYNQIIQKIIDE